MLPDGSSVEANVAAPAPLETKKWGFKLDRDPSARPVLAKELNTPEYFRFTKAVRRQMDRDPYFNNKTFGVTQAILSQQNPGEFGEKRYMDTRSYLTEVTEMFEMQSWGKKLRLDNYSHTALTDEELFAFADALGEVNIQFGGAVMKHIDSIVVVPDGHPYLFISKEKRCANAKVINTDKILVVNAGKIEKLRRSKDLPAPVEQGPIAPSPTHLKLEHLIAHELMHFIQFANEKPAREYEARIRAARTRGERSPTAYGEKINQESGRLLEDAPETFVVDTYNAGTEHIGPGHGKAINKLRADMHSGIAGPTIVTCRQLNPEDFRRPNAYAASRSRQMAPQGRGY